MNTFLWYISWIIHFQKNSILESYLNNACFNGRVASEEGKAYGKKILILAGKASSRTFKKLVTYMS